MDISALTVWVAVLAIATVVQVLLLISGAWMVWTRLDRAEQRIDAITAELRAEIRPLIAQMSDVMTDVRDVTARMRRLDMQITSAAEAATRGLEFAKAAVVGRFWPAIGLARAGAAAFRALRHRSAPREPRQDALALARFVNEGGPHG